MDAKLHDIPNTMRSTVNTLKDLKVNYLTVHISSGLKALKAVKKVSGYIKIAGVTTLTSLDNKDLKEIGYKKSVKKLVIHQSKLARKANLDAIVCSAHEIEYIIENHPDIKLVLGGIHPTIMWEQMARRYPTTIVVIGEGEVTFGAL